MSEKTIEELEARIRELEAEVERLKAERNGFASQVCWLKEVEQTYGEAFSKILKKARRDLPIPVIDPDHPEKNFADRKGQQFLAQARVEAMNQQGKKRNEQSMVSLYRAFIGQIPMADGSPKPNPMSKEEAVERIATMFDFTGKNPFKNAREALSRAGIPEKDLPHTWPN